MNVAVDSGNSQKLLSLHLTLIGRKFGSLKLNAIEKYVKIQGKLQMTDRCPKYFKEQFSWQLVIVVTRASTTESSEGITWPAQRNQK